VDEFNEYVSVILIDPFMNLRTIKSAINHVAAIITLHLFDVCGVIGFVFTEWCLVLFVIYRTLAK
jgi:hypothetical protein